MPLPPTMQSALRDSSLIRNWHAHVYFDAGSRQEALQLRQAIETQLAGKLEMARFHEKPVGPHPMWSYQLGIATADLVRVRVFVHPNTGEPLRDHRDAALWIGSSHEWVLSVFDGDAG